MTAPTTHQRRCFAFVIVPDDLHHFFDPHFERSLIADAEEEATGDTRQQFEDHANFEAELQDYYSTFFQWHIKMCQCSRP